MYELVKGTLYSHFASRRALVGAALHRVGVRSEHDADGTARGAVPEDPVAALVAASRRVLGDMAGLWVAAGGELSLWELRRLRHEPADRIRKLVMRGRRDGTFRTDQNVNWQMECICARSSRCVAQQTRGPGACRFP